MGRDPRWARAWGTPEVIADGVLEVGSGVTIASIPVVTHVCVRAGALLRIGAGVVISHGVAINVSSQVLIEDDVVIGSLVTIIDSDFHRTGVRDAPADPRPILIGCGARLGAGAVVLRGVTIAAGAEVLPGSVVARSILASGIHGGVPARPCGRVRGLHVCR